MPDSTTTRTLRRLRLLLILLGIFFVNPRFTDAQDAAKSPPQSPSKKQSSVTNTPPGASVNGDQTATLEAKQQSEVAGISHADGDVDLRYQNTRLRADHVEYNNDTQVAI